MFPGGNPRVSGINESRAAAAQEIVLQPLCLIFVYACLIGIKSSECNSDVFFYFDETMAIENRSFQECFNQRAPI